MYFKNKYRYVVERRLCVEIVLNAQKNIFYDYHGKTTWLKYKVTIIKTNCTNNARNITVVLHGIKDKTKCDFIRVWFYSLIKSQELLYVSE